jgi:hypothetical protein
MPQKVKQLHRFLGVVQYYIDLWARCNDMLSPLTNMVGECGHTKATRAAESKRKLWHWNNAHQTTFDNVNTTIAKEI